MYGCYILNKVSTLAVPNGDVLNTLLCSQNAFDNRYSMGYAGGNQSARKRAKRFAVYRNTGLFIHAGQAIDILPVHYGFCKVCIFCIGNVVADAAALVACKAARIRDFGKKARIRRAMAHLHRCVERVDDLPATANAMVHRRKAVQHAFSVVDGFFNAHLCFLETVLAGVAVNRCGQQIRFAFVLEMR